MLAGAARIGQPCCPPRNTPPTVPVGIRRGWPHPCQEDSPGRPRFMRQSAETRRRSGGRWLAPAELHRCLGIPRNTQHFLHNHKLNLVKLAGFYPNDFSLLELRHLPTSLTLYINDMLADERFNNVKTLAELSVKLVETNKYDRHQIVYKLLKLVIVLPVATASVERVFSVMNYVKNKLRNKLGDQYLNDCLVTFIEREFFLQVQDKNIINRFQAMKERRFKGRL